MSAEWLTVEDLARMWTEVEETLRAEGKLPPRSGRWPVQPVQVTTVRRTLTMSRPHPEGSTADDLRRYVDRPVPRPAYVLGLAPVWTRAQEPLLRAWWEAHKTGDWAAYDAMPPPDWSTAVKPWTVDDVCRVWTQERDATLRVQGKAPRPPIAPRTVYNYLHLSQPSPVDGSTEGRRYAAAGCPVPAPVQRVGGGRSGGYPLWHPRQEQALRDWWNSRPGQGVTEYGQAPVLGGEATGG